MIKRDAVPRHPSSQLTPIDRSDDAHDGPRKRSAEEGRGEQGRRSDRHHSASRELHWQCAGYEREDDPIRQPDRPVDRGPKWEERDSRRNSKNCDGYGCEDKASNDRAHGITSECTASLASRLLPASETCSPGQSQSNYGTEAGQHGGDAT